MAPRSMQCSTAMTFPGLCNVLRYPVTNIQLLYAYMDTRTHVLHACLHNANIDTDIKNNYLWCYPHVSPNHCHCGWKINVYQAYTSQGRECMALRISRSASLKTLSC